MGPTFDFRNAVVLSPLSNVHIAAANSNRRANRALQAFAKSASRTCKSTGSPLHVSIVTSSPHLSMASATVAMTAIVVMDLPRLANSVS